MPAVGFGMGDVVLTNVLADKGLVPADVAPRPDAFVLAASDEAAKKLPGVVAMLRRADLHARMSYKTTRNVGKLLKDATNCGARFAVIVGDDVQVKNLETGDQSAVAIEALVDCVACVMRRGCGKIRHVSLGVHSVFLGCCWLCWRGCC